MRNNQSAKNTTISTSDVGADAIAKLAAVSLNTVAPEFQAAIEALGAQAARLETALDTIPQGVCFFDETMRLTYCNRRFREIFRIEAGQAGPGSTLREIAKLCLAAGTSPIPPDVYLNWCASICSSGDPADFEAQLADGRSIHIRHQPLADGGWMATYEDFSEAGTRRASANERISLQALIDRVPDYLWVKDLDSRFVVANMALAADSGRASAWEMIGLTDFDLHASEAASDFRKIERDIMASGQPMIDREESIVDASGTTKWMSSTKVPVRNEHNEIVGLLGIAHDITSRRQAETLRNGQAHILEMIAMNAPLEDVLEHLVRLVESQLDGIFGSVLLLDTDGQHLRHGAGPSLAKAYTRAIDGIRIGPATGSCGTAAFRREAVIVADTMDDPLWADYRGLAAEYGYRSCWSTPIPSHTGAVLGVFAMYSSTIRHPQETELRLIDTATRIAGIAIERKQAEDRVNFLAHHDALTGLPNRVLLMDRIRQAILPARRDHRAVTVVFADLDNFKLVNDSLGHDAGDSLLKTVAERMAQSVRATDSVVRLGGDEFVILLADQSNDVEDASITIEKIRAAISQPIVIAGQSLHITCSMGIAMFPQDGEDAETLLCNADTAMYQAKALERDNFQFFTAAMNSEMHQRLMLREELRAGLDRGEFQLAYQPQVDLRSGKVFAVEALVRWQHPEKGLIPPDKFISLAEDTGLIVPLGRWVLEEACRQNKAWQDTGLPPIVVCVNVSARQFREKAWVSHVTDALAGSGLEAKYLELELTESLLMQNLEHAIATMKELQSLGVSFAIDDFGTGYSSLSALKNFPVARLKIDQAFIRNLPDDLDDRSIAAAVISLGQKLNMRVIAEGVETEEQMTFLHDHHCDEIQGYYFSRPVDPDKIQEFLAAKQASQ